MSLDMKVAVAKNTIDYVRTDTTSSQDEILVALNDILEDIQMMIDEIWETKKNKKELDRPKKID